MLIIVTVEGESNVFFATQILVTLVFFVNDGN